MKFQIYSLITVLAATSQVAAFSTTPMRTQSFVLRPTQHSYNQRRTMSLYSQQSQEEQNMADEEIERLKSMAQKLRAEAAALESQRADELAEAAQLAFEKFDTNKDGEISFEELKSGLERMLKTDLPEARVKKLMEDFDVSGDGKLQPDEFVGLDKFRNRLEQLIQEEKQQARDAAKAAQQEAEAAKLAEARLLILNDKEPTTRDKLVSVLPYLFPLMDSLQFGRFLLVENADNPFLIVLALLYALYRAVPFSGFISFLALNVLSGNPGLNRLVRFNMQQAIFVDIALFFPGLLGAAYALIASGAGAPVPPAITELGSDVVFGTVLLTILYASVSSLLGITPNKIPLISQAVEDRMPTVDMFDDEGRFVPRQRRDQDENDKKDN